MAIYQQDNRIRCVCGCDTFSDAKLFIIEKKQNSSTLTNGVSYHKTHTREGLMCSKCGIIIDNPMK